MNATQTTTIREWLASIENSDSIDTGVLGDYILDLPLAAVKFCICGDARLFVSCSGTAIVGFEFAPHIHRRNAYLVSDDSEGQRWAVLRAQGVGMHQMGEHGLPHYRPSARLRLVQSA